MKKLLLLFVMASVGLAASAQFKSQPSVNPQTNSKTKMVNLPQSKRSFQAVAPRTDLAKRYYAPTGRMRTLDLAKVKPVARAQRVSNAELSTSQTKVFGKGNVQNHRRMNLQPTITLNPQASSKAKAPRKAPAFAETYTGMGVDYGTKESVQWTMTPSTATVTNEETGETEEVNVLVDVIPTPDFLSELYPDGVPVMYTMDEDGVVTITPQALASYQNEAQDTTFYVTLFSANSDDEDGIINMTVGENGKLTITNGNWICFGEFSNVEFDVDMGDSEDFMGLDVMIANISYYYHIENVIDQTYNGHGVDYFANVPVDWEMQRGRVVMDDEESYFFVDMSPLIETFSGIYPDGIDVEFTKEGNTITVKPQVIASIPADEEMEAEYIMICSGASDDGNIVLTEGEDGSLKTISGESVIIGAWSTDKFDPTFNTYLGAYSYIDNVKYRLPDAPAEAPEDVACEPEELVLFAGLGYSGYSYNDNLAVIGAYAPTTFRNLTMDIATDFDWSIKEYDEDDAETTLTGNNRNFSVYTKGGAVYENLSLTAHNEDAVSEPYIWGTGHALSDDGTVRYDTVRAYAGRGANFFFYGDGTYAVMTRQNPDYDLTFYLNWATPELWAQNSSNPTSMSTIYSYQGKPATPLFLTGVTLPFVEFSANDDFNLHIKLCKCSRSATGVLTLGDVIAESDATMENVVDDYDAGLTAVEFTELYVEDEFGMSEIVDYLFIEDEFVIVIEGWDNGSFNGVLGSQEHNFNEVTSTWFQATGETRMRSYGGGWPQLFIGLLDATYGYLYTDDETNIIFDKDGGTSLVHVDPMYYGTDDETEEPTYLLDIESVLEDGEEVEEVPEWLTIEVANEDYTTATEVDEDGNEYEYFVNGIDYDLVFTTEALPEGVENRTCQIVFFQTGAKLTITVIQDIDADGISTVVEKTPIKNSHAYNLAGQRVNNHAKGIIVKNGKKQIVK